MHQGGNEDQIRRIYEVDLVRRLLDYITMRMRTVIRREPSVGDISYLLGHLAVCEVCYETYVEGYNGQEN